MQNSNNRNNNNNNNNRYTQFYVRNWKIIPYKHSTCIPHWNDVNVEYTWSVCWVVIKSFFILTHFTPLVSFDTPWSHQKIRGFLMFSRVSKETKDMKWVKEIKINGD